MYEIKSVERFSKSKDIYGDIVTIGKKDGSYKIPINRVDVPKLKKSCSCDKNCFCATYKCAHCGCIVYRDLTFCSHECSTDRYVSDVRKQAEAIPILQEAWKEYLGKDRPERNEMEISLEDEPTEYEVKNSNLK
jgi:hypothetical protein